MSVETQKLFSLWDSIKLDNFDDVGEIGVNSSGMLHTVCTNNPNTGFRWFSILRESLSMNISGVIQKYGKKLKWFGQGQSSFELENEGRLLPVENADLIGRVGHIRIISYESFRDIGMNNPL